MSVEKRVAAYLELASQDLDAADLLATGRNRYAAYHLQQALEKLLKALLLSRSVEAGLEHRLEELLKRFPDGDTWPERVRPVIGYSAYATAFRYPTPGGRIPSDPPVDDLRRDVAVGRTLLALAHNELLTPPS